MKAQDFVEKIVKSFIDGLDQHGSDWQKGWLTTGGNEFIPVNGVTGSEYSGSNVFTLMALGAASGYQSNKWATYKQWQSAGKQVNKGQKATGFAVKYGDGKRQDENGDDHYYKFMRAYALFNEEQLLGYERVEPPTKPNEVVAHAFVDDFIVAQGSTIHKGGDCAFYQVEQDFINIPMQWKFKDTDDATATQNYYSTLLHEHVHWTGHKTRLDRDMDGNKFSSSYAYEELVAELGSVLLSLQFGLSQQPTPDHAKYINGWKTGLRNEPKALLKAMADAQKAVSFLQDNWAAREAAE